MKIINVLYNIVNVLLGNIYIFFKLKIVTDNKTKIFKSVNNTIYLNVTITFCTLTKYQQVSKILPLYNNKLSLIKTKVDIGLPFVIKITR